MASAGLAIIRFQIQVSQLSPFHSFGAFTLPRVPLLQSPAFNRRISGINSEIEAGALDSGGCPFKSEHLQPQRTGCEIMAFLAPKGSCLGGGEQSLLGMQKIPNAIPCSFSRKSWKCQGDFNGQVPHSKAPLLFCMIYSWWDYFSHVLGGSYFP